MLSMNRNLTTPDNPPKRPKPVKIPYEWREGVVAALVRIQVPQQIAELAVIDFKDKLGEAYREKHSPGFASRLIIGDVDRIYKLNRE